MTAGIRVLGPLAAEVEGARADLGGPLQRAVLALLLMERGRVVSVDRVPYAGRTYDILPSGPTGVYWADGVPLRSTLAK